jgi:hypothetical protein
VTKASMGPRCLAPRMAMYIRKILLMDVQNCQLHIFQT